MNFPGRLVIVEGTDGSGKSTQIYLLKRWLESKGYPVVFTEWNSSELVKTWTKKAKQQKQLTPTTFSLIHSSDFFDRYERVIVPLLRAGYIVLADRYIYTAIARDTARGCSREWVRNTYASALRPSLALYFQTPLDVAVNRILVGRAELKYHEAGLDIGFSDDPVESFQMFQGIIKDQYDQMVETDGLTVIDATLPIDVQQAQVRKLMKEVLSDYHYPVSIESSAGEYGVASFTAKPSEGLAKERFRFRDHDFPGKIITIEGSDYSGHYKQSKMLTEWLETRGYAVYEAGIKRSKLMRKAIDEAKEEHFVGPHTMSLFYATDFADELENGIIPALRAGMVVVADRYVYTLIARQLARGMSPKWLNALYSFALQPDLMIYLDVPANDLIHRCFASYGQLSYWESGMDLAISPDPLDSALAYQSGLVEHYRTMMAAHEVEIIDGTQSNGDIQSQIRQYVKQTLKER